jgi:hypothetical protein
MSISSRNINEIRSSGKDCLLSFSINLVFGTTSRKGTLIYKLSDVSKSTMFERL